MRVLIASDHFPPFIGGAHRWAPLLASGLASRGHDVTVATVWHGGLPRVESYGEEAVGVHRVRQLRTASAAFVRDRRQRHAPPFPDPVSVVDLRRVVRAARPEVVLSHGWLTFSVVPALAGSDVPLIVSAHDYGYFCANRTLLHHGHPCSGPAPGKCMACAGEYYGVPKGWQAVAGVFMSKHLTARRASATQCVSSFVDDVTARHLLGAGGRGARRVPRYIVPAFVAPEPAASDADVREVEERLAQVPDVPFILFVGALRPLKGVGVLLDAYRRLERPPPLVLAGTIERDTELPFPGDVTVLTDVSHRAVIALWDRALIGVAPSVWPEPLGTVAIEGLMRGVPMIATVPSGMADVLGDGAGVLIPQGDPAALAHAMSSLLADPARRQALTDAGPARARRFESDQVLRRYEDMLEQIRKTR